MKESTSRFPDLVNMIKELCKPEVSSFILDAEVSLILKDLPSLHLFALKLFLLWFCKSRWWELTGRKETS
jgi:hypothetical protein